jgi:hypothetical protein
MAIGWLGSRSGGTDRVVGPNLRSLDIRAYEAEEDLGSVSDEVGLDDEWESSFFAGLEVELVPLDNAPSGFATSLHPELKLPWLSRKVRDVCFQVTGVAVVLASCQEELQGGSSRPPSQARSEISGRRGRIACTIRTNVKLIDVPVSLSVVSEISQVWLMASRCVLVVSVYI